jgi:putative flippase GtrA
MIDNILSLIIGEISAWLIILISKDFSFPYLEYLPIIFPVVCLLGMVIAQFLSKKIPVIREMAKFVLVGGLNFLVDMGVLTFLISAFGIFAGALQSIFKAISFLVAVGNSYLWNKHWTFKGTRSESAGKEFFQFFVVSVGGFLINVGSDYILVNIIGSFGGTTPKVWAQLSAAVASGAAMAWNYIGYKFFVFEKPNSAIR